MEINRFVLWIIFRTNFSVIYALSCSCGNVEENRTVFCDCTTQNNLEWFHNGNSVSICFNGFCAPQTPSNGNGATFTDTGSTFRISIPNFSMGACRQYTCKDTVSQLINLPYCPVLTMTKPATDGTIIIEENTQREFICTFKSSPAGTIEWYRHTGNGNDYTDDVRITTGVTSTTSSPDSNQEYAVTSTLRLSPDRTYHGNRIYCKATNKPEQTPLISDRRPVLNILYYSSAPNIDQDSPYSVIEGTTCRLTCSVTGGHPFPTLSWNCNGGTQSRTTISGEKRTRSVTWTADGSHNNICRCTSSQTGLNDQIASVTINILYAATVKSFYIDGHNGQSAVTVNEYSPVPFNCSVDSVPIANTVLKYEGQLLRKETSNTINHELSSVSCQDAGTYACAATNENNQDESKKTIKLFVNCKPRSADSVIWNQTCERNATFTFTFNALAYPDPTFVWKKWSDTSSTWNTIENGDNIRIKSTCLQSKLTILSVTQSDYTQYLLQVSNEFGQEEYEYNLAPIDKPDAQTEFQHIAAQTTEFSIQLRWTPGSNGGSPQTFYIKYKKSTSEAWNYVSVPEDGEEIMEYTLTGLEKSTEYHLIIYSSNVAGNSPESEILKVHTKGPEVTSNIGAVIGGTVGGTVGLVTGLVLGIIFTRRHLMNKYKKECDTCTEHNCRKESTEHVSNFNIGSDEQPPRQNEGETTYYNEGSASNYESLNQDKREDTVYTSIEADNGDQTSVTNERSSNERKLYVNLQMNAI